MSFDSTKVDAYLVTALSTLKSASVIAMWTPTVVDDEAIEWAETKVVEVREFVESHPEVVQAVGVLYDTLAKLWAERFSDPSHVSAGLLAMAAACPKA